MTNIDSLWILVAAGEVFLMQVGFIFLEIGQVRNQNIQAVTIKNVLDWLIVSIVFCLVSFSFMFGRGESGLIGSGFFGLENTSGLSDLSFYTFFLFQLAFAGTTCTILSGCVAGRTGHFAYGVSVLAVALIVYPIYGFWVWGGSLVTENEPWLASLGFHDFAGASVVHSIGAWCGLVGAWIVGPRLGWMNEENKPSDFAGGHLYWSFIGVLILWLGWWGFNGGSVYAFDERVGKVIVATNLAGAAAGLSGLIHARYTKRRSSIAMYFVGSIVAGLVAVTACADIATIWGTLALSIIVGPVHNYALDFIKFNLKIDDAVGAVAAHGVGGAIGILAVPFIARDGVFENVWSQFGVQALGLLVCFAWATSVSLIVFTLLKRYAGLRVSPEEELSGITLDFKPARKERSLDISKEDLEDLLGS